MAGLYQHFCQQTHDDIGTCKFAPVSACEFVQHVGVWPALQHYTYVEQRYWQQ